MFKFPLPNNCNLPSAVTAPAEENGTDQRLRIILWPLWYLRAATGLSDCPGTHQTNESRSPAKREALNPETVPTRAGTQAPPCPCSPEHSYFAFLEIVSLHLKLLHIYTHIHTRLYVVYKYDMYIPIQISPNTQRASYFRKDILMNVNGRKMCICSQVWSRVTCTAEF